MSQVTTMGIDIAQNVVFVHGVDAHGHVVTKRLARQKVLPFAAPLPLCLIGIEALGSTHYWAHAFTKLGHTVKLLHPQFVKPYMQSQKNDPNDAVVGARHRASSDARRACQVGSPIGYASAPLHVQSANQSPQALLYHIGEPLEEYRTVEEEERGVHQGRKAHMASI